VTALKYSHRRLSRW